MVCAFLLLATRVGTTRTGTNYFMNKFRELGLIEYTGELKATHPCST
jgi:CRP/FNR family cyclic AMP-dependent transcriptional regulator